jgi:glutathione synthase/RimK-type ligase-like ATP-grasp enzyme
MKKVLVLFGRSNWRKSKPFSNEKYMYSYEYFYELCRKNGIQVYRASYQWYDYEKRFFKHAWVFGENGRDWKRTSGIKPDLIFDKVKYNTYAYDMVEKITEGYKFFNNIEFTKIIDSKLCTSLLFPEWSKKSFLITSNKELGSVLRKIASKRVVVKPINLSGGDNVMIGTKEKIIKEIGEKKVIIKNWIAQGFIDSSKGIPGIMEGTHDLRVVLINDKIIYAYYRRPANGSLLANLAQGGTMEIVDLDKLPQIIKPIISKASSLFSVFGSRIFTIDLMFDKKRRPWIVELNSMPGMYFAPGQEKTRKVFYSRLLREFKNKIKQK